MSSRPGVSDSLALLKQLRETVHEFAAREEKLIASFRARSAAENKTFDAASGEQASRSAEALAAADSGFQAAKQRCRERYEQRKSRISQGHMASRKRALEAIREREGKRKYKVQEGTLGAERRRESALADAAAAHEQFQLQLAETRGATGQLEHDAQRRVRGYRHFQKSLASDGQAPGPELAPDADQLLAQLQQLHGRIGDDLKRLRRLVLMRAGRHFPLWLSILLLLAGAACLVPTLQNAVGKDFPWQPAGIGALAAGAALLGVRLLGRAQAKAAVAALAGELARARRLHDACFDRAESRHLQEQEQIKGGFETATMQFNNEWKQATREAIRQLDARPKHIDEQAQRVTQKSEQLYRSRLEQLERDHPETLTRLRQEGEAAARKITDDHSAKLAALKEEQQAGLGELETEWKHRIEPVFESIRAAGAESEALFPEWQAERWKVWEPPRVFQNAAKFAQLEVDVGQLVEKAPADPRLALPAKYFSLPLQLTYPLQGSILFETGNSGAEEAMRALNNIIFRLLSTTPPGKLSFTIFDPVGLGQNFAGLMHLADYEETHINSRIWTQTGQLEEKLAELNEHMEKVIQMYLRNEYATIAEYNAQAGTIAEKYHFLVIADFPVNFSDTAARRLVNIATSGARCGVYTLIHWDKRHALPPGLVPEELRKSSVCLVRADGGFKVEGQPAGVRVQLDAPPSPEFATEFLRKVGESGKDSNRVEVPFDQVAPPDAKLWTETTNDELRVAIGRSGATKLQYLEIGRGTRQHALIAGKTGSGKSTLFHVIITNLALWCSPEQVEFYLVDFKKGVEFKCYATRRLPHGRVVAIESDREFGLSVLQRVDEELRRRGDLFRQLGVQDLAGYRRSGGAEALPRSLLLIDEFQEFFTEEDRVSQGAAVLLDRIVRQGRAFGIHVVLGSQTLGGAYTLARATIGQMVIRVALQCNEADAYLIMDQDNPAPRLLSRPGEGIYNDAAGAIEGNSPFQAVWLPEDVRDSYLAKVRARADQKADAYPGPFVFEGNAPADVRDNAELRAQLQLKKVQPPPKPRVWLGAPNAVKGPTEAAFQRQSGSNLLIVGQSEEPALAILSVALVSLAAQYPKGSARFLLLDSTPPGFPQREFLERLVRALPHDIEQVKAGDLPETMSGLAEELKRRSGDGAGPGPEVFVLIHGFQNYKKLKQEDEFSFSAGDASAANPAAALMTLLTDGPAHGIHVIVTFDTYNNVNRFLGRKTLGEFEMRVLFQMSASDSASLIDDPGGSTLGLHRALFYNDREGYLETFRPYALPANEWVEEVAGLLKPAKG